MEKNINSYNFFSYDVNESLLLTEEEEKNLSFLMNKAWDELNNKNDNFSIQITLSYISLLLNISERFYSRQFNSRTTMCNKLADNFFKLLKSYYREPENSNEQPSVFYFSEKLNITPGYLSDTIKHYSGKSALNLIHEHIIEEAIIMLKGTDKSISEISYQLGFEYPTYFSRLFKKKTKFSPSDFRKSAKSI